MLNPPRHKHYLQFSEHHISKINKIRILFGLAGVNSQESAKTKRWGNFFEWTMLVIVFWLPVQWYLENKHFYPLKYTIIADWIIWFSFVTETISMSWMVKRKLFYLLTNWINLIIIIIGFPLLWTYFPLLATIRITRVLFMVSILVPWFPIAKDFLSRNHLGTSLLICVIVTFLSGVLISSFDPGITSPFEGIWWAWETVTTVGYGDVRPVSLAGKILAIVIMLMGIGLISVLTANISAFLIGQSIEEKQKEKKQFFALLNTLIAKVDSLEGQLKKSHPEIRSDLPLSASDNKNEPMPLQ